MEAPGAVGVRVDDHVALSRTHCVRLLSGLVPIFTLFQWIATALHSDRGQAGVIVAIAVVSATRIAQRRLYRGTLVETTRSLGLGIPVPGGLAAACASCASLAIVQTAFVMVSGVGVTHDPPSLLALAGLFAQGVLAEETLFRDYLFGDLGAASWCQGSARSTSGTSPLQSSLVKSSVTNHQFTQRIDIGRLDEVVVKSC